MAMIRPEQRLWRHAINSTSVRLPNVTNRWPVYKRHELLITHAIYSNSTFYCTSQRATVIRYDVCIAVRPLQSRVLSRFCGVRFVVVSSRASKYLYVMWCYFWTSIMVLQRCFAVLRHRHHTCIWTTRIYWSQCIQTQGKSHLITIESETKVFKEWQCCHSIAFLQHWALYLVQILKEDRFFSMAIVVV